MEESKGNEDKPSRDHGMFCTVDQINSLFVISNPSQEERAFCPGNNVIFHMYTTTSPSSKDYGKFSEESSRFYLERNAVYIRHFSCPFYMDYSKSSRWGGSLDWKTSREVGPNIFQCQDESKMILDKSTTVDHLETGVNSRDHWELNRRRPSVIRRSIPCDADFSCPREAILSTECVLVDSGKKDECKTEDFRSCATPEEPQESPASSQPSTDPSKMGKDSEARVNSTPTSTPTPYNFTPQKTTLAKPGDNHSEFWMEDVPPRKNKYFKTRLQLLSKCQAHKSLHSRVRRLKCNQDGRCMTKAEGFRHRVATQPKTRTYKYSLSSKTFTKTSLEEQLFQHNSVKQFACEYCSKQYTDAANLEAHLLLHKRGKRFRCQQCNHSFISSKSLIRHIKEHTGGKPFKCQSCNMSFSKRSALIAHSRVHSGIKSYSCLECGKAFSISVNLQRHKIVHSGRRPYKCVKCQKTFNNPSHLSRHIKSQHT